MIRVADLIHRYGDERGEGVTAIDRVNLTIDKGEFVSLVGPSGCGKSTLLLIIAGLLRPSEGTVQIDGVEVISAYSELGFVFQDPTLLEWRTVLGNILLQAEIRKLPKEPALERAMDLIKRTGLEGFESAYPAELSGGMRQRVSICRALLHQAPILLMDEPFGALDALTRERMASETQELWSEKGLSVVFVTHDIEEAVLLSDRVVVMSPRPGKIVKELAVDLTHPRGLDLESKAAMSAIADEVRDIFRQEGVLSG